LLPALAALLARTAVGSFIGLIERNAGINRVFFGSNLLSMPQAKRVVTTRKIKNEPANKSDMVVQSFVTDGEKEESL